MTELGKITPVKLEVRSCKGCPHSSNNVQEQNDSFRSTPLNLYWYCNQGDNTRETVKITDPDKIAEDCPLRKKRVYGSDLGWDYRGSGDGSTR